MELAYRNGAFEVYGYRFLKGDDALAFIEECNDYNVRVCKGTGAIAAEHNGTPVDTSRPVSEIIGKPDPNEKEES